MMKKTSLFLISAGFLLTTIAFVSGCGGGGFVPPAVGGPTAIVEPQSSDNDFIMMPPGHSNRIVFESERGKERNSSDTDYLRQIFAMNSDGSGVTLVAKRPTEDEVGSAAPPSTAKMNYITPGVTSDGLRVYFATDYFATTTSILKSNSTGGYQKLIYSKKFVGLEDPAVSWDGKKVAFIGYTSTPVTAAVTIDKAVATLPNPTNASDYVKAATLILHPTGYKMTTNAYVSETGTTGIMQITTPDPTDCPAASLDYSASKGVVDFAGSKKIKYNNPVGKYYCINLDNTNFILIKITGFTYSITKDISKACTSNTKDADCGTGVDCGDSGRCLDDSGNITYTLCSNDVDCGGNTCNKSMYCALDEGLPASMTFEWKWIQKNYTDTFEIEETIDETIGRMGAGVDFIKSFDFKSMDLFTMNADGTDVVQRTDDDDTDRYPCFAPGSSDVVYFTKGTLDLGSLNIDDPTESVIKKLTLSTGVIETFLDRANVVRDCAFNPAGTKMAYSYFNGTNFDIYTLKLSNMTSELIYDSGQQDMAPSFSPDGRYIAFQSNVSDDYDIYVTDLVRKTTNNITNDRDYDDLNPAWSP